MITTIGVGTAEPLWPIYDSTYNFWFPAVLNAGGGSSTLQVFTGSSFPTGVYFAILGQPTSVVAPLPFNAQQGIITFA